MRNRSQGVNHASPRQPGEIAAAAINGSAMLIDRVARAEVNASNAQDGVFSLLRRVQEVEACLGDTLKRDEQYDLQYAITSLAQAADAAGHLTSIDREIERLALRLGELVLPKTDTPKEGS